MANALRTSAKNKLYSSNQLPINEATYSSKVTLAYDALRELLEAIAIEHGYKIYNHE